MNNIIKSNDAENAIFHIGINPDGTMQDIINVRLPFGNHGLLMCLLNTERLGGRYYDCGDGGYFFMFDNSIKKPYPSVMIWRYKWEGDVRVIKDVSENDLQIIPYAIDTYLREMPGEKAGRS